MYTHFLFPRYAWSDTSEASNRLEELKRLPSDLRRYIKWSQDIKARYGGITAFVVKERLLWTPLDTQNPTEPPTFAYKHPVPFANESDYMILRNDWPYGLAPGITHICVWLKTPIETDPRTGDVTVESRRLIEGFVNETFASSMDQVVGSGKGKDHVLWFKNWVALQSVRGVDHVHVLVKDAPQHILDNWTKL